MALKGQVLCEFVEACMSIYDRLVQHRQEILAIAARNGHATRVCSAPWPDARLTHRVMWTLSWIWNQGVACLTWGNSW